MKPSQLKCIFFLMIGIVLAPVLAQGQENASDAARRTMMEDYNRSILHARPAVVMKRQNELSSEDAYDKERDQIASQMQIVTENEDVKYTILNGDTLTVTYKERDRANRAVYKVSNTGEIFVSLLGNVKVAGLNRKEARERIDAMLKEYIRSPETMISINTDGRLLIFGAVLSPGIYNIQPKLTVMEAILTAGGAIPDSAELGSVLVVRGPPEKPLVLKLNLKKLVTKGDQRDDILVKPGDFVYIPTSFISNLDKFWNLTNGILVRWYGLGGSQPVKNNKFDWWKSELRN